MKEISLTILSILVLLQIYSCDSENNVCDDSNTESIEWSINDKAIIDTYDDFEVFFVDNNLLFILAQPNEIRDWPGFAIWYDVLEESAEYSTGGKILNDSLKSAYGSNLEMTVSQFSDEGEFICIEFDNGEINGELRVKLDEIVQSGSITGYVWNDENENGIRESDESVVSNMDLAMSLNTDSEHLPNGFQYYRASYYPNQTISTDEYGQFTIKGTFVNHPIQLRYISFDNQNVTKANEGNNDTIDSDFSLYREVLDTKYFETEGFIISEGGIKNNIGLGIIE